MKIKSRHHLKGSESKNIIKIIEPFLDDSSALRGQSLEIAEVDSEFDLILVKGEPLIMVVEKQPFVTVRGALKFPLQKRRVVVDSGAIKYIVNGADVMAPGVVEADPEINSGDLVVVIEEKHRKPLAIGQALRPGSEMQGSGKIVKSLHHVGDSLWEMCI
ncbi:MAG: RNA-binding protein [Methanotrichaceae archaeon]